MNIFKKIFSSENGEVKKDGEHKYCGPVSAGALSEIFSDCYDYNQRKIYVGGDESRQVVLCYIDGLVSGDQIADDVIKPLTDKFRFQDVKSKETIDMLMGGLVYGASVKERDDISDVIDDLLCGYCCLVFEKEKKAITFETKTPEKRSIDLPKEEKVSKGSKDAFIEVIRSNSTLIRRKMKNPDLKFKELVVGKDTKTTVSVAYIKDFTNMDIVNEAVRRLEAIETEGILTAAALEENIVDYPKTPFPQIINTERPDKFCVNLLEGRVGILVDGLPIGYLVPGTFTQFFKVPEDIANHFAVASMLTILRYMALLITLLLPAFYVAVAMYHQEMLPTKLMQSIIDSKQSVPFPTAFEVITMLLAFELLQEAGLRLPNPIGETVSIIGGIIVGQSAVDAKVVSPVVVIVVAVAGIAGYTMPNLDMAAALRLSRLFLVICALFAGIFGVAIGCAMLLYHLCSLESFGVAYMTPFAGAEGKHISRAVLRYPAKEMKLREPALGTKSGDGEE